MNSAVRLDDVLDGLVENRQIPQAEKVHLQQTRLLDVGPLREDVVLAGDASAAGRTPRAAGRQSPRPRHACRHSWRDLPAPSPESISSLTSGSLSYSSWSSGLSSRASLSLMLSVSGTILAISSARLSGNDSARATSRIAALAFRVPKVPIWATFSSPYLSFT